MAKRGGSGGGRAAGGADQVQAPAKLPDGVTRAEDIEGFEEFTATVAGVLLEVDFVQEDEGTSISFSIGSHFDRSKTLTAEQSTQVIPKIREIINYRVSQAADGEMFIASAWTKDGLGLGRTLAYARAGMSAPAEVGGKQSGVVRNGKLVPTISPELQRARIRNLLQMGRDSRA